MKKIIIVIIYVCCTQHLQAQLAADADTLQWLQTHIEARSATHFKGKPLKVLFDSLYQLKSCIKEYNPPMDRRKLSEEKYNAKEHDSVYLFVDSLRFYFDKITEGRVSKIHDDNFWNNFHNKTSNKVNTHVEYIKVVFQYTVKFPRAVARSKQGDSFWSPFAEYFWSPYVVERVTVGEY
jgi:hypothetical protein